MTQKLRYVCWSVIGTVLELYDYTLFVILLPLFAEQMFGVPLDEALYVGYVLFALSFFIAPFGAIIWGYIGDRFGRKNLLRSSMMLMAIPSMMIAVIPPYEKIGPIAVILVFVCRCLQVISASGEKQGAKIFLLEHLGPKGFGLASAALSIASALGVGLAMLIGLVIARSMDPFAWRYAFLQGGVLALVSGYIRRNLKEPSGFKADKVSYFGDIREVLRNGRGHFGFAFALASFMGILTYFLHGFMNPFIMSLGVLKSDAYGYSVAALCATATSAAVAGMLIDKYGLGSLEPIRRVEIAIILVMMLLAAPGYYLMLSLKNEFLLLWYLMLGCFLGLYATFATLAIALSFTPRYRCRGSLFAYSLGFAIFGGTTPGFMKILANIYEYLPIIFLYASAIITGLALTKVSVSTIND